MKTTADPRKAFPRRFLPADADMGRWGEIEAIGRQLAERQIDSPDALER